jgi:hypothetical protein
VAAAPRDTSLYDLLEVGANATLEEIEASYHRIVSYLAPDSLAAYSLLEEGELVERRSAVDEAYRTLSDPARRAAYDRVREGGSYPQVLVPASQSDATMSVGMVRPHEDDVPELDVDAIFRSGGHSPPAPDAPTRLVIDDGRGPSQPAAESYGAASTLPPPEPRAAEPAMTTRPAVRQQPPAPAQARTQQSAPPPARIGSTTPRPPVTSRLGPGTSGEILARTGGITRRPPPAAAPAPVRKLTPSPSIELTPDTEFSGALLRRLRESCHASLDELARITKIRRHYLEAIEEHSFDALPAQVYVRGFVTEYARVLGLDTQKVASSYMAIYKRYRGEGA